MASEKKLRPESLDFFLAAIAPVFIIGMIGSLVYFIIIVCYEGPFTARLMWILGLYTVAAVLIARIAIEQSRQLAFTYMFALGAATLLVAPRFMTITGPLAALSVPILVGLLVLVAVLADRITFDCTSMNEQQQSTGVGLLQSLGLVQSERKASSSTAAIKTTNEVEDTEKSDIETVKKSARRKHNPGVWVLYFALLALPLFGLGQLAIRSPEDRRWAFTYLFVYLMSSLFLLVLISLLSLRKYLRERGVPMETTFAVRWLAIGMTGVFVVLFLLSMLPIPSHSLLSMDLPFRFTSRDDLKASKWGWGPEGVPGEGPQIGKGAEGDEPGENGANPGPSNDEKQNDSNQASEEKADSPNGSEDSENASSKGRQKSNSKGDNQAARNRDNQAESGNQPSGKEPSGNQQGDKQQQGNQQQGNQQADKQQVDADRDSQPQTNKGEDVEPGKRDNVQNENRSPEKNDGDASKGKDPQQAPKQEPPQGDKAPQPQEQKQGDQPKPDQAPESKPPQETPSMSIEWNLAALVQWLVMLVLLIVAVILGIKYRREFIRAAKDFADWISLLFGRKSKSIIPTESEVEGVGTIADLYPPFSSFENPFQPGNGKSREEMVQQMYVSVLSWGYERRVVRTEEETPEEFIRRLARRFPEQQESLGMLGRFYNRIAYARGTITSAEIKPLVELWQWLAAAPKLVPAKTKVTVNS